MRNFTIIYNKRNDKYLAVYESPFTDKLRTRAIHSLLSSSEVRDLVLVLGNQLINLDTNSYLEGIGSLGDFSYYSRDNHLMIFSMISSCDSKILKRLFRFIFSESIYFLQERTDFSVMQDISSQVNKENCVSLITSNNVAQYLDDLIYVDIGDLYNRGMKKNHGYNISNTDANKFSVGTSYYTLDVLRDLISSNLVRVVEYYKSLASNYRNADLATVRELLLSDGIINLSNCFDNFMENDTEVHEIVTSIHSSFVTLVTEQGSDVFNGSDRLLFSRIKSSSVKDSGAYNITKITQRLLNCVNRVKQTYLQLALKGLFKLPFKVTLLLNVGVPLVVENVSMLQNIKLYKLIDFNVVIETKYSELIGYDCFNEFMSIMYSKYSVLLSLVSSLNMLGDIKYELETANKFTLLPLGEFTGKHLELLDYGNLENLRASTEIQYFTDLNYANDWCLYTYFKFLYKNGLAGRLCLVFVDNTNLTDIQTKAKIKDKLNELQYKLVEQFGNGNIDVLTLKYKVWSQRKGLLSSKSNMTKSEFKPMTVFNNDKYTYSKTEFKKYFHTAIVNGLTLMRDKIIGLDIKLIKILISNILLKASSCNVKDTNFGVVSPVYGLADCVKGVLSRFINFSCLSGSVPMDEVESILYDLAVDIDFKLYELVDFRYSELVKLYHKPDTKLLVDLLLNIYTEESVLSVIYSIIVKHNRLRWDF